MVHNAVLSACETPGCMEICGFGEVEKLLSFDPGLKWSAMVKMF